MAKGLRASSKKSNKTKLRERVFRPVESARLDRLSGKLFALASKPREKAEEDETMEGVEKEVEASKEPLNQGEQSTSLDQDTTMSKTSKSRWKGGRVQKRGRRKAASSMVFPVRQKGRRLTSNSGHKTR